MSWLPRIELAFTALLVLVPSCNAADALGDADGIAPARDGDRDLDGAVDAERQDEPDAVSPSDADPAGRDGETAWDGALCDMRLDGTGCGEALSCQWAAGCIAGRCECVRGSWSCSSRDACSDTCPQPGETPCGSPCDSAATGCLCRCGGGAGPDYTACVCEDRAWACLGC